MSSKSYTADATWVYILFVVFWLESMNACFCRLMTLRIALCEWQGVDS